MESILINPSLLLNEEVIGRDDRIWTCDILYPKQTRYQAALHPSNWSTVSLYRIPVLFSTSLFPPLIYTIYMGISSFWSHLTYNNSKIKVLYTYEIRNGTCRKNKWVVFGNAREERNVFLCFKKKFYLLDSCTFQFELGIPCTRFLTAYASDHLCITILDYNKRRKEIFQCEI